jgi:hypothetical protein
MAVIEEVLEDFALHLEQLNEVDLQMLEEVVMVLAKTQNLKHCLDVGL